MSEKRYPVVHLGPMLAAARMASGMSMSEAARVAGFSHRTAGRIESGNTNIRISRFLDYGDAVGLPFRFDLVKKAGD